MGISVHVSWTRSHSSSNVFEASVYLSNSRLRYAQTYSTGLRSGEMTGHSITVGIFVQTTRILIANPVRRYFQADMSLSVYAITQRRIQWSDSFLHQEAVDHYLLILELFQCPDIAIRC